jgi:hypothetical protein
LLRCAFSPFSRRRFEIFEKKWSSTYAWVLFNGGHGGPEFVFLSKKREEGEKRRKLRFSFNRFRRLDLLDSTLSKVPSNAPRADTDIKAHLASKRERGKHERARSESVGSMTTNVSFTQLTSVGPISSIALFPPTSHPCAQKKTDPAGNRTQVS